MLTFPNLISSLFFHATVEIKLVQSNHYQLTKINRPFKIFQPGTNLIKREIGSGIQYPVLFIGLERKAL